MAETSLNAYTRSGVIKPNTSYLNQGGQTCLERFGFAARREHLFRNEWNREEQYTKQLVDSEYNIQTEFKVSSLEEELYKQAEYDAMKEEEKAMKKYEKKLKKAEKDALKEAKAASVKGGMAEDSAPEPKEVVKVGGITNENEKDYAAFFEIMNGKRGY